MPPIEVALLSVMATLTVVSWILASVKSSDANLSYKALERANERANTAERNYYSSAAKSDEWRQKYLDAIGPKSKAKK